MAVTYGNRQPYYREVRRDNPTALWRLGETSGTIARDEMGLYNGTYVGSPTLGVSGAVTGGNTAVGFNGTSQYITTGSAAINAAGTATIEMWIYPTAATGGYLWTQYDGVGAGNGGKKIILNSNGTIGIRRDNTSSDIVSTGTASLNQWNHLVCVFASGTNAAKIYINSVLAGQGTLPPEQTFANHLRINGRWVGANTGSAIMMTGYFDEIAKYNYALSPAQILKHYTAATQ